MRGLSARRAGLRISHCVYENYPDISKFDPASILILERLDHIQQTITKPQTHTSPSIQTKDIFKETKPPPGQNKRRQYPLVAHSPIHLNRLVFQDQNHISYPTDTPLDLTQIPTLIANFTDHVHIKNPVLAILSLQYSAALIAENGLRWDASSALVLLASALGTLATPFTHKPPTPTPPRKHSTTKP